jgi:hypothetical protein
MLMPVGGCAWQVTGRFPPREVPFQHRCDDYEFSYQADKGNTHVVERLPRKLADQGGTEDKWRIIARGIKATKRGGEGEPNSGS